MSITKIRVYSYIDLFGSEASERDVELYNDWLDEKLRSDYPNAEIEVRNEPHWVNVDVFVNGENDRSSPETAAVEERLQYYWETCPWDFL